MQVGPDGRIHTEFGHNPSSLRLCSFSPNLQNIPRGANELERYVKDMFMCAAGTTFWERDFSGIEAKLVGYFAGDRRYVDLASLGVHAFLASHVLGRPADLAWSRTDLVSYFKEIKRELGVYNMAKRVIHGSNYMMTPRRMHELFPESFATTRDAAKLQGLYFDLFPSIRKWHRELCDRVDGTKRRGGAEASEAVDPWTLGVCYARNPFGYVHHFYNVLDWERIDGEWHSTFGEDAKRLVSFLPQSTAAAIIKQAAKRLFYDHPHVGLTMRLLIHDSILGEAAEVDVEECLRVSREVMEAPIRELPLDPQWKMGEFLTIGTEAKVGRSWGDMH